ncbi:molecular chaperone DnaJ [Marisediminicola senii]|uniref:molecular chaperone DnaJ n=1 Tax=Marisediminicola senii TaxID=2711233 RepID=UPI0013EDA781|nr:molecular chaperone DnaJ [Marisediminicola senii]
MSLWPTTLQVAPIREWPGTLTAAGDRRASPFSSTLTTTLKTLNREILAIVDTATQQRSAQLLIALPPGAFRLDGRPRADARPEHPGVIFSIDSRHGHLSYPCDTFTTWQDNLRAIALALEALRKVDRYGVTKRGEQYRGFAAIEATAMSGGFSDRYAAWQFIMTTARGEDGTAAPLDTVDAAVIAYAIRTAKRKAHPDTGGDATTFHRVTAAAQILEGPR